MLIHLICYIEQILPIFDVFAQSLRHATHALQVFFVIVIVAPIPRTFGFNCPPERVTMTKTKKPKVPGIEATISSQRAFWLDAIYCLFQKCS
jgi:hypothetical protein